MEAQMVDNQFRDLQDIWNEFKIKKIKADSSFYDLLHVMIYCESLNKTFYSATLKDKKLDVIFAKILSHLFKVLKIHTLR